MSELEKRISTYRGVCFSATLNEKNGSQLSIHKVISSKLAAVRPTHSCALAHCGQLQPNGLCVLGVDGCRLTFFKLPIVLWRKENSHLLFVACQCNGYASRANPIPLSQDKMYHSIPLVVRSAFVETISAGIASTAL